MSIVFDDQHHGHGGSYRVDPKTGKRELVERTGDPEAVPEPNSPAADRAAAQDAAETSA
jgi:hypothetical protein